MILRPDPGRAGVTPVTATPFWDYLRSKVIVRYVIVR